MPELRVQSFCQRVLLLGLKRVKRWGPEKMFHEKLLLPLPNASNGLRMDGVVFGALCFFCLFVFCWWGGWRLLKLCHFYKLWPKNVELLMRSHENM